MAEKKTVKAGKVKNVQFLGTGRRKKSIARVRLLPNGTGKKLTQKMLRSHSGYIGGLKEMDYKTVMATKSDVAVEKAVKGMLPKNSLGRKAFTRLRVYKDANHNHEAQKPQTVELKGARN